MLEVGEGHMQDKAYFAAIDAQMDKGGREALLDHLLQFDLKGIDLRTIPKTAALLDKRYRLSSPWKDGGSTHSCADNFLDYYLMRAQRAIGPVPQRRSSTCTLIMHGSRESDGGRLRSRSGRS